MSSNTAGSFTVYTNTVSGRWLASLLARQRPFWESRNCPRPPLDVPPALSSPNRTRLELLLRARLLFGPTLPPVLPRRLCSFGEPTLPTLLLRWRLRPEETSAFSSTSKPSTQPLDHLHRYSWSGERGWAALRARHSRHERCKGTNSPVHRGHFR